MAIPAPAASNHAPQNGLDSALHAYLRPFAKANDFSGVALLLRGDHIVAQVVTGLADQGLGVVNRIDTRFYLASMGKMFTVATILTLADAGKLSLDDPLSRFIPTYPGATAITLRMLMEHKAGIARDINDFGVEQTRRRSADELVGLVAAIPPIAKPGAMTAYSNNGYRILARVIETAGHGGFVDLVRETVFEPRGMNDTIQPGIDEIVPQLAQGYVPGTGWGSLSKARPVDLSNWAGAGSFYSTAADMARFAQTLPLGKGRYDDLTAESPTSGYPPEFGHNGSEHGFFGMCYRFPADQASLIVLSNIRSGLLVPAHDDLRAILFSRSPNPPHIPARAVPIEPQRLAALIGSYALGNLRLRVTVIDNGLWVDAGGDPTPLIHVGGGTFFSRIRYALLDFEAAGTTIRTLVWNEGGKTYRLPRVD